MIIQLVVALQIIGSPWPQMPPARFDHPYRGHLTVLRGDQRTIYALCHNNFAAACAWPAGPKCTIVLPKNGDPQILAALRRHEIAHCNGWPANHPQ